MEQYRWDSLQNRLVKEAKETLIDSGKNDGIAIVTVHIVMDGEANPLFWVVQKGKRIEPSKDARRAVTQLLQEIAHGQD